MSPTCPECGEEIDCDDCGGGDGDSLEWIPKAFKECEEATLKPFKELADKWISTQPDPESDGLSDAPLSTLLTIQHGRELKKIITQFLTKEEQTDV